MSVKLLNCVTIFERDNGAMPPSYALHYVDPNGDVELYCPVSGVFLRRWMAKHQSVLIRPDDDLLDAECLNIGYGWRRWEDWVYMNLVPYSRQSFPGQYGRIQCAFLVHMGCYNARKSIRQGKVSKLRPTVVEYSGKYGTGYIIKTYKTDTMSYWTYCIQQS